jgi:hypothetical protein
MARNSLLILLIAALFGPAWADWTRETVGMYSWYYEVKVGDGRNDGVQRVYCSAADGHVVEWTYDAGAWSMMDCGGAEGSGDIRIISLWLGDGRGDEQNRLYGACANGDAYEFFWNGSEWEMDTIGTGGVAYAGIAVGAGRNDGASRVYAGGWYTAIHEYSWDGSGWDQLAVSSGNRNIWPMYVGPGRNDGVDRLYCPDRYQTYLREYTWETDTYDEVNIESPTSLVKVIVGDGRNDGIQRVYGAGLYGHIQEFTYDAGNWDAHNIHPDAPGRSRYGLCFGRAQSDGWIRLDSVAQGGDIREHSWTGAEWTDTIIDAISGATVDLAVGPGRNDDTVRVYVASIHGWLFEFTHDSPYHGCSESSGFDVARRATLEVRPNPSRTGTTVRYDLPGSENALLCIYDATGRELLRLVDGIVPKGTHTLDLDNPALEPGVYFCRLLTEASSITRRFVRLR